MSLKRESSVLQGTKAFTVLKAGVTSIGVRVGIRRKEPYGPVIQSKFVSWKPDCWSCKQKWTDLPTPKRQKIWDSKPRARKSSDNWVKSRQMSKISQWKDIFWNWAGYLLIHLYLTWKQTLRVQHFLEFDFLRKREKSVANLQERQIPHEIMRLTTKSWDLASLSGRTKPITVYENEYRDWFVVLIIQCTCDLREYGSY